MYRYVVIVNSNWTRYTNLHLVYCIIKFGIIVLRLFFLSIYVNELKTPSPNREIIRVYIAGWTSAVRAKVLKGGRV